MRSRKSANDHVAEVARRRLELLGRELAGITGERVEQHRLGQDDPPDRPAESREPAPSREPAGRHAIRSVGVSAMIAGWVRDRLPPTLQGRVQLGASHLTLVAVLVAIALAVSAWWVVRAGGAGSEVPVAVVGTTSAPTDRPSALVDVPGGPSSATTASAPSETVVVIDVAGKVRRPGIATLPAGSRVADALDAAGGVRRGARVRSLNLARVLVDGEQLLVGISPPAGVAASAASAGQGSSGGPLVPLNSATAEQLETLPGVGPVTAAAILAWRTDNGAFTAVDELLEISGIGDATLAKMAPFVTL